MDKNKIYQGDCVSILKGFPVESVDVIFADPPYNLQLSNDLKRPNEQKYDGVDDNWDKFQSNEEYDKFSKAWLKECKRVMKKDATIWVIGTYHNIFRIGKIMQDLGFWILNDILWVKSNPTPNFMGTRFNNAHETLIWASRSEKSKYTFNYQVMKRFNDGKQMRSDWIIPICQGAEREQINGEKAHSTQKPEGLLMRVILSSSKPGDLILDPFFGSGTTGAVAKKLKREWIGIEKEKKYIDVANSRINSISPPDDIPVEVFKSYSKRTAPKVRFSALIEVGMIKPGEMLYSKDRKFQALVKAEGTLISEGVTGSIHKLSAHLLEKTKFNGWDFWFAETEEKDLLSIDLLREKYRKEVLGVETEIILDNKYK